MKKELLEKRKVALKKLLENKRFFCSGFCHLIAVLYKRSILTYEESDLLDKLLYSYFDENKEVIRAYETFNGFYWEPGNWEEREKWILYNLETIDLLLNSIKQSK